MSFDTYAGLKTEIANLIDRTDLTAKIPGWITMAEASMNRVLKTRQMIERVTITASGASYPIPAGFAGAKSFRGPTGTPMVFEPIEAFDARTDITGTPTHFSVAGDRFLFNPIPGSATSLTLLYRRRLDALGSVNATNWLLEENPDAYLYGAAVHSAPYLAEDERIAVWQGLFQAAIRDINADALTQNMGATLQTASGINDGR